MPNLADQAIQSQELGERLERKRKTDKQDGTYPSSKRSKAWRHPTWRRMIKVNSANIRKPFQVSKQILPKPYVNYCSVSRKKAPPRERHSKRSSRRQEYSRLPFFRDSIIYYLQLPTIEFLARFIQKFMEVQNNWEVLSILIRSRLIDNFGFQVTHPDSYFSWYLYTIKNR